MVVLSIFAICAESHTRPAREKQVASLSLSISRQNIYPVARRGFLFLTHPDGGALTRTCRLGMPPMPSSAPAPGSWLGLQPCRLRPGSDASVDRSSAASPTSVSGFQRNACSPWSIGLRSVCSLLLPQIHQPSGVLRIS